MVKDEKLFGKRKNDFDCLKKNVFQTDWCQIRILASGKQITAKLKFSTDLHNWFEFFKRKNKKYD
jgi:hypothetical protein